MAGTPPQPYTATQLYRYMQVIPLPSFVTGAAAAPYRCARVVRSRHADAAVIDAVLHACNAQLPDGILTENVWIAAGYNPRTAPELLRRLAALPDADIGVRRNPSLGADVVADLWASTNCEGLLGNPVIATQVLHEQYEQNASWIACNPAAPAELLRSCWAAGHRQALSNPALPRDALEVALESNDENIVAWAVWNPQLTVAELETLRARHVGTRLADFFAQRIQQELVTTAPLDVEVRYLDDLDVIDPLADAILAEGDHADAVISVLRAGFTGTVGELLECAGAVTG